MPNSEGPPDAATRERLRAKYERVMREQGRAHPGEVYDPVFEWWIPAVNEPALLRFLDEEGGENAWYSSRPPLFVLANEAALKSRIEADLRTPGRRELLWPENVAPQAEILPARLE